MMHDFCSYNVRGLNKKLTYIKDFISLNKFSIVGLLETHVKERNAAYFASLVAPRFSWLFNYNSHPNGRIWFGWDSSLWNVTLTSSSAQHITCKVTSNDASLSCTISMVYAFNTCVERRLLWNDLFDVHNNLSDNFSSWCMMGDFNTFLSSHETNGTMPRRLDSILEFKNCINDLGITDL